MSSAFRPHNLPTRDYAKIADALENFPPLVDDDGRERVVVTMSPVVLQHIRDGLRRLSRIDAKDQKKSDGQLNSPSLDSVEAGAPEAEIEITPEMIEAGFRVLWDSGAVEHPMEDADRSLVQKIFVAMNHVQGDVYRLRPRTYVLPYSGVAGGSPTNAPERPDGRSDQYVP